MSDEVRWTVRSICRPGLGKFDGICRPCGNDGQRACPALEQAKQCGGREGELVVHDGMCRRCGGEGAPACSLTVAKNLLRGRVCEEGVGSFDGVCEACGAKGERSCPGVQRGRTCSEEWTREEDGACVPCGAWGQQRCEVRKLQNACQSGLKAKKKDGYICR